MSKFVISFFLSIHFHVSLSCKCYKMTCLYNIKRIFLRISRKSSSDRENMPPISSSKKVTKLVVQRGSETQNERV